MAQATIKAVWRAGNFVYVAVEVVENSGPEFYQAKVPTSSMVGKTNAERREILRQAIKDVRDIRTAVAEEPDPTITGTLDI